MLTLLVLSLLVGLGLLVVNFLLAARGRTAEGLTPYECGFSAPTQTRSPINVQYYLVGLLFLIFDLEVALLYPGVVAIGTVGAYGIWLIVAFLAFLTVGFVFEFGVLRKT
jgi:NADH:ubiquinone oxidoreductase subunit 3 (subunit A)